MYLFLDGTRGYDNDGCKSIEKKKKKKNHWSSINLKKSTKRYVYIITLIRTKKNSILTILFQICTQF